MPRRDHSSCSCLTTASILKVPRSSRADGSDASRAEQRYKELDDESNNEPGPKLLAPPPD